MSYSQIDLEDYVKHLEGLCQVEKKLVEGGLMFSEEALSIWNVDFIKGRIERINSILNRKENQ